MTSVLSIINTVNTLSIVRIVHMNTYIFVLRFSIEIYIEIFY